MESLIPIVLFLSIAGVLILRPLTRPLGRYLDSLARDRAPGKGAASLAPRDLERMTDLLDRLNTRIDLLEDRMQFVERLADGPGHKRLTRLAD